MELPKKKGGQTLFLSEWSEIQQGLKKKESFEFLGIFVWIILEGSMVSSGFLEIFFVLLWTLLGF